LASDNLNISKKLNLPSKIHFLGIGGAGMNPLAGICLKNGIKVTGSDSTPNANQDELRALGADIWTPHSLSELKKRQLPQVCAFSTAILPTNPEYNYLKEQGVQFWHRSDLLKAIADNFDKQIVISGTHGKTTTTAMLVWILEQAGINPCWVLGGVLKGLGSYGWNDEQHEVFIFEGDESDQSFLKSNPYIGLVTSLEPDHLENYNNSFEVQIKKFQEFAQKSQYFICSTGCKNAVEHLSKFANVIYGVNLDSVPCNGIYDVFQIEKETYEVFSKICLASSGDEREAWGQLDLPNYPGLHNKLNALGAVAIAHKLGINPLKALLYLKTFPSAYRRFDIIGTTQSGITVVDDYAHHPTEVRAAINAGKELLKEQNKGGKLIVLFQPHLPTRLRDLWKEFTECFEGADKVFLADLYIARGEPIAGIDSKNLAAEIKHPNLTHLAGPATNLIEPTTSTARENDLILILGAGDITYIRETLFNNLRLKEFPKIAKADKFCGKN
jgi:UDP-N-acetylmuramate--alanine ligase